MAPPLFFSVTEPTGPELPVVVEVPHAGVYVDPASLATLAAPGRSIGRDADLFVDELYAEAPALGATLLVAHVSRYVCDLNRAEADVDTLAVEGGGPRAAPHGIIWRSTTDEQPALYAPLPRPEFDRRMSAIYRPYHQTLARILEQKHARFGHAILLCAHSMPSSGRAGHSDPGHERADVVPGSRGGTTASLAIIRAPELVAREYGWSVTHDEPYRGGYSTSHYGRPEQGVHAIQVELARRLYMDEEALAKNPNDFAKTQRFCAALVARLATISVD
jgi:N-formylglutamate amidohydrolase